MYTNSYNFLVIMERYTIAIFVGSAVVAAGVYIALNRYEKYSPGNTAIDSFGVKSGKTVNMKAIDDFGGQKPPSFYSAKTTHPMTNVKKVYSQFPHYGGHSHKSIPLTTMNECINDCYNGSTQCYKSHGHITDCDKNLGACLTHCQQNRTTAQDIAMNTPIRSHPTDKTTSTRQRIGDIMPRPNPDIRDHPDARDGQ